MEVPILSTLKVSVILIQQPFRKLCSVKGGNRPQVDLTHIGQATTLMERPV